MKEFEYTVQDQLGIHARPAGLLVKAAKQAASQVKIEANGKSANAKKLMALMSLGVKKGQEVKVTVEGPDEEEAAGLLEQFFRENL